MLAPYIEGEYNVLIFEYYENGIKVKRPNLKQQIPQTPYDELCWSFILKSKYNNAMHGSPWAKLFSKKFVLEHGLKFESGLIKGQDCLFMVDVLSKTPKMDFCDVYYYHYRMHADSVCTRYNPNIIEWAETYRVNIRKRFSSGEFVENCDNDAKFDILIVYLLQSECSILYFFNPSNTKSYRVRRKEFLKYIKTSDVKEAIKNVKLVELRPAYALVLLLIKCRMIFLLNLLYKIQHWRNRYKN
jgi:hypothetical protein